MAMFTISKKLSIAYERLILVLFFFAQHDILIQNGNEAGAFSLL